jgi:hypothetical protein
MPFTAKQAKERLLTILRSDFDPVLGRHGFERAAKSTAYGRIHRASRQRVELFAQRPNNSAPRTEALIQSWVSIEIDAIVGPALDLVGGKRRVLGDEPARLLRMPTGFTTPKRAGESWRPEGAEDWAHFARQLIADFEAYLLPFLDEFRDPAAFVQGWKRADTRLVFLEDVWVVKLAAACLVAGERDLARTLVTEKLATPPLRRRFAATHAFFSCADR